MASDFVKDQRRLDSALVLAPSGSSSAAEPALRATPDGAPAYGVASGLAAAGPMPLLWPLDGRRNRRDGTRRVFRAIKAQHAVVLSPLDRIATRLTRWASSTPFLVLHVAWFAAWISLNTGVLPVPFDPFPFGLLTMVVSLEAIVLSLFVLMTQSRESAIAELREEVTLAVNLRVEEEVTKVLELVAGLYTRLGYQVGEDPALDEMLKPLDPAEIERDLVAQIAACMPGARS